MDVNFSERLRNIKAAKRMTIKEIADKLGMSERMYSYYESGNSKGDPKKIEKYLPNLEKLEKNNLQYNPQVEKLEKTKNVPYYDVDATAGNVTIFAEDSEEYIKEYISVPAFQDCEMFINVSGSSMYPKYVSGELIALKKLTDFEVVAYGEAYLIVTREQRLLKYIKKSTYKNMWALHSEHKDYEPFDIHIAKVLHLYMVKGKITKNVI